MMSGRRDNQPSLFDDEDLGKYSAPTQARLEYLIDSNCLMTPYNEYYSPDFFLSESFWNQLHRQVIQGSVGIIRPVYQEVFQSGGKKTGFNQKLNQWLRELEKDGHILPINNAVIGQYADVINYLRESPDFSDIAVERWSEISVADPWLIAFAKADSDESSSVRVVTFERKSGHMDPHQPSSNPKIPDVADHFGVSTITLFEFMRREGIY